MSGSNISGSEVELGRMPSVLNIVHQGKPFVSFYPDGTILLAKDAKPDDAAQMMMTLLAPLLAPHCGQLRGQVRAFHGANGVVDPLTPTVPPDDRVRFRARLIAEEALETIAAMFSDGKGYQSALDRIGFALSSFIKEAPVKVDMVAFADGCADLDYVTEGARQEFGIDGAPIAAEVHRSNMAKVGGPMREDGKVMKPPGWTPPDVAGELRKQGWNP